MDKIPDRAAVNERLIYQYGHKGVSGFVNGILKIFLEIKNL